MLRLVTSARRRARTVADAIVAGLDDDPFADLAELDQDDEAA